MIYSDIALKIFAAKESGRIKSNAEFWKEQKKDSQKHIDTLNLQDKELDSVKNTYLQNDSGIDGIICAYDNEFPVINPKAGNGDKPYLLFYKGNISLLQNLNNNVAVIGLTEPTEEIKNREIDIVKQLTDNNLTIVSGLAKGCDTTAHKVCVDSNKHTIAILPTEINNIFPAINKNLADEIVRKNGLLLTEYYKKAANKYEAINRLVKRDKLQAMFSKAIVLIASYRKNEGDSGSRHAMEAAEKYGIARFVMLNETVDKDNTKMGLNFELVKIRNNDVIVFDENSARKIHKLINPDLQTKQNLREIDSYDEFVYDKSDQLNFDWNMPLPAQAKAGV